jgi:2-oxoglutarate dehydrogenase E1 component
LRISNADQDASIPPELNIDYYGWTEADLSKEIKLGTSILPRFAGSVPGDSMTIGQIIDELKRMYCMFKQPKRR